MKEGGTFVYATALLALLFLGVGYHLLPGHGTGAAGFGRTVVQFGGGSPLASSPSDADVGSFTAADYALRQRVAAVAFDDSLTAEEGLQRIGEILAGDGPDSSSSAGASSAFVPAVHDAPAAARPANANSDGALAGKSGKRQVGFREFPGGPQKPPLPAGAPPWCTPDQMESIHGFKQMNDSSVQLPKRRYNKGCSAIRHNYKCANTPEYQAFLADDTLRLVPTFAADGKCSFFGNEGQYPFPDHSRILIWGNSHLRELITAIICQFPDAKPEVIGTDQDNVCNPAAYSLKKDHSEIMWRAKYANNVTVFGLCNCGLMYDKLRVFSHLKSMLGLDPSKLTHVIANPANVAAWAVKIKYKQCTSEPWHKEIIAETNNGTNRDLYEWNPFPTPTHLRNELATHGFAGKIVWTLPFWCKNRSQANIYRRPAPPGLLAEGMADGFLDTSEFICPEKMYFHRCQVSSCSRSNMGQHQCLPGPPDDMAAALMHILHTV